MSADEAHADRDDDALVERARAGDDRALDVLVTRHNEVVYRVALGILQDGDLAADAAQDAFIKAFRSLDRFRGEAAFRTWLLTIAANEARSVLRRKGRRRELPLDAAPPLADGQPDAASRVIALDEVERARGCLAQLPEKQRLAVQLRVDEGLSFREVGELIGSSEGAARVNYHHGIRRLREMLEE